MLQGSFRLELVQLLFEQRTAALTALLQASSFLGEIEGYVLVVSWLYVTRDKQLAFRLAVLALVAMSLNHVAKTLVANPRPFLREGDYLEKWAVSPAKARELAAEYATPSGHAMAGSCFYAHLCASVRSRWVRTAAIVAILLTGLSRPYLGVHYVEDVLLGWAAGLALALLAARFAAPIGAAWRRRSWRRQGGIVLASSAIVWLASRPLYEASPHGQPLPFVAYLGLLAGLVLAHPLEERWVRFDPRSSGFARKGLRFLGSVALTLGTLLVLDRAFALLASDSSPAGIALRYLRYAAAGVAGVLVGPFLFVRTGLAERMDP